MEKQDQNIDAVEQRDSISQGRRQLLKKAGWAIPIIAATPLLNTATAVSTTNCDELERRLNETDDDNEFEAILRQLRENNCIREG